jgi:hypothetical protein
LSSNDSSTSETQLDDILSMYSLDNLKNDLNVEDESDLDSDDSDYNSVFKSDKSKSKKSSIYSDSIFSDSNEQSDTISSINSDDTEVSNIFRKAI